MRSLVVLAVERAVESVEVIVGPGEVHAAPSPHLQRLALHREHVPALRTEAGLLRPRHGAGLLLRRHGHVEDPHKHVG